MSSRNECVHCPHPSNGDTPTEGLLHADALRHRTVDSPVSAAVAEARVVQLEVEVVSTAVGDKGGFIKVGVAGLLVGDYRGIRALPSDTVLRTQKVEVTLLDRAWDDVDEADVFTVVELDVDVSQALSRRETRVK